MIEFVDKFAQNSLNFKISIKCLLFEFQFFKHFLTAQQKNLNTTSGALDRCKLQKELRTLSSKY